MKFHLHRHSTRIKSLVLVLLLSFVGQAWALSDVCSMPSMADVSIADMRMANSSPCHSMNSPSDNVNSSSMAMDCCDSASQTDQAMPHDCSCPDSGCSASFTMAVGFTSAVHIVHEQAAHYSTIHFLNRISTSLYRPPIA